MRNEWYGDSRDFVKWQSLLDLGRREGIIRIWQVAMCTDTDAKSVELMDFDGNMVGSADVNQQVASSQSTLEGQG